MSGDYIEIGGEPLFPRYVMRGQRLPTGAYADSHAVWLASWFRTNYLHHHVRPLDLAFHLRLRKPIAKALYPLLELGWYATGGQPSTKSYPELCHEFLLQEYRYVSQIKQQLEPAHHELTQQRFLERWEYRPAAQGPSWVISYYPGPKFFEDQHAREARRHLAARIVHGTTPLTVAPPAPSEGKGSLLADILMVCGDRQNQAAYQRVLREYPEELMRTALAETRQAAQEGRIRKSKGAYFMDALKRLTTLRAAPDTPPLAPRLAPAREAAQDAAQEPRAQEAARQHTQARVDAVLAALTPAQRQTLEERATAQFTLREHDLGYRAMLRVAREQILLHEQLGFDCWSRLVAQARARGSAQAADDVLVVSVPTTQDKKQLTEHSLAVLEELASTPPQRMRIQVLVR